METKFHYITYLLSTFIRPYHSYKKHEEKLGKLKTSFILSFLMSFFLTVAAVIRFLFYNSFEFLV